MGMTNTTQNTNLYRIEFHGERLNMYRKPWGTFKAASAEGALEKFYETSGEFRDKFYAVALY